MLAALRLDHQGPSCTYLYEPIQYDKDESFTSSIIKDWTDADVQAVKDGSKSASQFIKINGFPSGGLQPDDRKQLESYTQLPESHPRKLDFSGDGLSDEEIADFGLTPERRREVFGASTKIHKFRVQQGNHLTLLAFDVPNIEQEDNIPHQAISIGQDDWVISQLDQVVKQHRMAYRQRQMPEASRYVRLLHYTREQFSKRLLYAIDEYQKSYEQAYPKDSYPIYGRLIFFKVRQRTKYLAAEIGEGDDKRTKVWLKDIPPLKKCPPVELP